MSAPPSAPEPRLIARSMVSLVMLADSALSTAARRRGLPPGSATPARVATVISRISLVNTLARLASSAFLRPSMDGPLPMAIPARRDWTSGQFYPKSPAVPATRGGSTRGRREVPDMQEAGHQLRHLRREQQAGVAALHHAMVSQARQAGLLHRHRAVVLAIEMTKHGTQTQRHAAGDHADLARAVPALEALLDQLAVVPQQDLAATTPTGKPARRRAAAQRRAEADDASLWQRGRIAARAQREQAAQAVPDQMHGVGLAGQIRDAGVQAIQDALLAGRHAEVVE